MSEARPAAAKDATRATRDDHQARTAAAQPPMPRPADAPPLPARPRLSVIVPTYRRPDDLARCLAALARQQHPPDEVVVTRRDTDDATRALLERGDAAHADLPLAAVVIGRPGVIAAMNAGLAAAHGDVIALTDDDTEAHPDWTERILAHFAADPGLGGVGGRDWQPLEPGERDVVGTVSWFGYTVGNHHLGHGAARAVDVLKGANCAYRGDLLRAVGFDERLRGAGAQVHWELSLGLAVQRAGWRLVYDPAVAVDHYPGQRHDSDNFRRGAARLNREAVSNAVHNETLVLLHHLAPGGKLAFFIWSLTVGTRASPGIVQLVRLVHMKEPEARTRWRATLQGRVSGLRRWLREGGG